MARCDAAGKRRRAAGLPLASNFVMSVPHRLLERAASSGRTPKQRQAQGQLQMPRPLAFDITHLVSRLPVPHPSGIDKVDMAYARHFAANGCAAAVHYGLTSPHIHPGRAVAEVLRTATQGRWAGTGLDNDPAYARLYAWLTGHAPPRERGPAELPQPRPRGDVWTRRAALVRWRLKPGNADLPRNALYLNVAQHGFEVPRFFAWLDGRPDVLPVFLVHDLLPLDYPEYFRPGYKRLFTRRVDTIVRHARAIVTTSRAVGERIGEEYRLRGRPMVPLHVEPLPSPLAAQSITATADPELRRTPYFVVLGTIEPRKNHLLLLNVWRRMAEEMAQPPKLVIAGTRGWENEQVWDVLDRSTIVRPHLQECSGLADPALVRILANARALLMPSFAEGYGLPVVEALSLAAPVIASDIPVFREIAHGRAVYRHPLDGPGWRQAIEAFAADSHPLATEARTAAAAFAPPNWPGYFAGIDAFLKGL